MAPRAPLAPYLPAQPLTAAQRQLFDDNLALARRMAKHGLRKFGAENEHVVENAALMGLMCAAARYTTPSPASFSTFAIRTIRWVIRLVVLRELGVRERKQKKDRKRAVPLFEFSDMCASEEQPDSYVDHDRSETVIVDRRSPDMLLINAEREDFARRVIRDAHARSPSAPRRIAMLLRYLDGETLSDIGRDNALSRERVRQLVAKAKQDIAHHARAVA